MKLCAACRQDLSKDKFSKKQWKLGAKCQRRCTSCVADNREVQPPPIIDNNESANNNTGIVNLLDSMCIEEMQTISDEDLFKQPPQKDDCPICFLRMPALSSGSKYEVCCGKVICSGCIYANAKIDLDKQLCPFCRTPAPDTDNELVKRNKKRMEDGDAEAIYCHGVYYDDGMFGLPQNRVKALELYHQAGELGEARAYTNIGYAYINGEGVSRDEKKAKYYWELAAILGSTYSRFNLGILEESNGNMDRALKHFMIAAAGGYSDSLSEVKNLFKHGHATKDDYTKALRAHQLYVDDVKSDQRDKAAAYSDEFKYY